MRYLALAAATVLGAILYRMGGASGYNTKVRDCGIATVVMAVIWFLCPHNANHLIAYVAIGFTGLLTFLSQTTYFKKKGTEARWYHWCAVGFVNGISLVPYSLATGTLDSCILRTVFLTVFVSLWSSGVSNVVWEEGGRGALIIASLLVYL